MPTVPMLAPDGTSGEVPQEQVQAAIAKGFKQAVEMTSPDGKAGYIPMDRQQDALKAGFKPVTAQSEAPPEGFWHSLGSQLGLTPEAAQQQMEQFRAHPIQQLLERASGVTPIKTLVDSVSGMAKGSADQLKQAYQAQKEGNTAGVVQHAVTAIPIVGPALNKAADQQPIPKPGQSYLSQVGDVLTNPGTMGTLTGASAQAAPVALGVADAAVPGRPVIPNPPVGDAATAVKNFVSPAARMQNAGELFKAVAKDANSVPVSLDNAGDAAVRLMDWQGKTQLGPSINKFLNRITNPKMEPLTYSDARQFYQILGRLSADETSKLPPVVQRDLAQMVSGLKTDIGNSADQVGQAANYYQAMGDYATAKRLQGWYDFAKKTILPMAVKGAASAAGAGAAGAIGYQVYRQSQQ